jgi:hypothetical protein
VSDRQQCLGLQLEMSETILRLIPNNPTFVPDLVAQQAAQRHLKSLFPPSIDITIRVTEQIEFIDQGQNLEGIYCPF